MAKKTVLYDEHRRLGAQIAPFAGYDMPIQYSSIREEHQAVRQHVGLFDVSHMGEYRVTGAQALAFLEWLTTNQVSHLKAGRAQYNLLPNEQGGLVDDIYLYCLKPGEEYVLCVNAANDEKDGAWLQNHRQKDQFREVQVVRESERWAQIAVQGPRAPQLVAEVLGAPALLELKKNYIFDGRWQGNVWWYATSGYTGELGGEIFIESAGAVSLWRALLEHPLGAKPCGLGARDVLRLEMGYPLYGHEIGDELNPLAAGLGWVIKAEAKEFVGRLMMANQEGTAFRSAGKKLVGLVMEDRSIPRDGYRVLSDSGLELGWISSGSYSPSLGKGIAMAFVALSSAQIGSFVFVEIRDKLHRALIVELQFYKKINKKG